MFFFKYFKDVFRFSSSLDPCHSQSNPSPPHFNPVCLLREKTEVRGGDLTFHGSLWQNFSQQRLMAAKTPGFNMVKAGKSTPPTKETAPED